MITRYLQSDPLWKNYEYDKGTSIGVYGCLLTTITNELNNKGFNYTPQTFAEFLKKSGCFDNGYIVWNAFQKATGYSMIKYLSPQIPMPRGNNFLAIQVPYLNTGHYCNVLEINNKVIKYFDVYDGKEKTTSKWISIREFGIL